MSKPENNAAQDKAKLDALGDAVVAVNYDTAMPMPQRMAKITKLCADAGMQIKVRRREKT